MIVEILGALGLTFILKQGRIFNEVRSFLILQHPLIKDLFDCAMCLGFWAGLFVALLTVSGIINCFIFALCISFLGFITQHILTFICKLFEKL